MALGAAMLALAPVGARDARVMTCGMALALHGLPEREHSLP